VFQRDPKPGPVPGFFVAVRQVLRVERDPG